MATPAAKIPVAAASPATRITAIWRDRVHATRQIPIGGRSIDLALAQETGVDAFLAGSYKLSDYLFAMLMRAISWGRMVPSRMPAWANIWT